MRIRPATAGFFIVSRHGIRNLKSATQVKLHKVQLLGS